MAAEFNVNDYWLERGRTYLNEQRVPPAFHQLQERFFVDVLKHSGLRMRRVLEIGCGFGRITKLVAQTWPQALISALDLSPIQLAHARQYCGANPRVTFGRYDFYSPDPLPAQGYDVILAIEVFLHHPPDFVGKLVRRLAAAGRHIVNIDWSEAWPWPTPEHVWVHDFPQLYRAAGLRCATFVLPEKVDGKQQKLFIAGQSLPEKVGQLQEALRPATTAGPSLPTADDWSQKMRAATSELRRCIPPGGTFLLADDGQWGNLRELAGYRVIRLLEKDGEYWGPPADDETAWKEVERWRRAGASHLALAWPSFWWLKHYPEFYRRVRDTFRCVVENAHLMVFQAQPPSPR